MCVPRYIHIAPKNRVAGNLSPALTRQVSDGYAVRVVPLQFIAAGEMQKILEPSTAEGASVRVDRKRNLVFVAGTRQEIATLQDTIAIFDVDWLHRLDRPGQTVDKRLYVYHVQNAKANDLGNTLRHIFNMSGRPASAEDTQPVTDPAGNYNALSGAGPTAPLPQNPAQAAMPAPAGADNPGLALPSGQPVDIIADAARNALVILATLRDYRMVQSALTKPDTVPLQVLTEASIIEVSLKDEPDYGVEWFFKNNFERGNVTGGRGALDLGAAGITALTPSFSCTVLDNAGQARIALNALEQETRVNVLSPPSLMVLDNQAAYINVGDEIPVPSRQSVSNINPDSPTVNEIQFGETREEQRRTELLVLITPRVIGDRNDARKVTEEFRQKLNGIAPADPAPADGSAS